MERALIIVAVATSATAVLLGARVTTPPVNSSKSDEATSTGRADQGGKSDAHTGKKSVGKLDDAPEKESTEAEKRAFVEQLLKERGILDPRGWNFPETAHEYAKLIEPEIGVPPKVDLGAAVEIPLYVNGVRAYGNLHQTCDNPSRLGKDTVSGSVIQRYEGRRADGTALPDVVWVSFGRNSTRDLARVIGSVQMIGYHRKTGATAFFESCDQIHPWVTLEEGTQRMRGVMPWIDDPEGFNEAFRVPDPMRPQCVQCHQADPFITNSFINAAKILGTDEPVVPILDENSPFYVIGGENWDMRTIHIQNNGCLDCHRVGMSTMTMFMENGWDPNKHMPPKNPGSLSKDLAQLMKAWREGPESVEGGRWIIPPERGHPAKTVVDDYPNKARFNEPARNTK